MRHNSLLQHSSWEEKTFPLTVRSQIGLIFFWCSTYLWKNLVLLPPWLIQTTLLFNSQEASSAYYFVIIHEISCQFPEEWNLLDCSKHNTETIIFTYTHARDPWAFKGTPRQNEAQKQQQMYPTSSRPWKEHSQKEWIIWAYKRKKPFHATCLKEITQGTIIQPR